MDVEKIGNKERQNRSAIRKAEMRNKSKGINARKV